MVDLLPVFLTGLTVGGLSCLTVQGGLLASIISLQEKSSNQDLKTLRIKGTLSFLLAKLVSHTFLGFLLGMFGEKMGNFDKIQGVMQMIAGIYMLMVAGNLLELHPVFRYTLIQPPRFITRFIRNKAKSEEIFAPAFLGAVTIFIPCGTTLAMEALVISSASSLWGAIIMFTFVLGTTPLFAGLGVIVSIFGEKVKKYFTKIASLLLIYLGVVSIFGALISFGFSFTPPYKNLKFSNSQNSVEVTKETKTVEIFITDYGYSPDFIQVNYGTKLTIRLISKNTYSCALAFRMPSYGISKNLRPNDLVEVSFTPERRGRIPFNCSMGMYQGVIEVI